MAVADAYLAFHARLANRPRVTMALLAAGLLLASSGLCRLDLDLSFRPLFATGDGVAGATAAYEDEFGQQSGSQLLVILDNRSAGPGFFFAESARVARRVEALPGVAGVSSLATLVAAETGPARSPLAAIASTLRPRQAEIRLATAFLAARRLPGVEGALVSNDGRQLLLAARLASSLDDIDARRRVVRSIRTVIDTVPAGIAAHLTGVSAVEVAYEERVLKGQLAATALTSAVLSLLLFVAFGRLSSLLLCLLPVSLAIPATLGLMGWLGIPVTIINTSLPALVLVIGVADAVHMHAAWIDARHDGHPAARAVERMLARTGRACAFTTLTTAAGFLSLLVADLTAVAQFGLAAALGIAIAFVANQALLPWLSMRLAPAPPRRTAAMAMLDRTVDRLVGLAGGHPRLVVAAAAVLTALMMAALPALVVDQRFNEELPADDPVTVAQQLAERRFGGFLGPELVVEHRFGESLLEPAWRDRLELFLADVAGLPGVQSVRSVFGTVAPGASGNPGKAMPPVGSAGTAAAGLVSNDATRLAVIVQTGDLGTRHALELRRLILERAGQIDELEVRVVGQWWLAQYGMSLLLDDMLRSLLTASLAVLPLLWLLVRHWRRFVAALVANLLPVLLPLGFMAAAGIRLRIGTAVVLAVALGIAVDNTLHVVDRLVSAGPARPGQLGSTGRAVALTTLALVGAFVSMLANDLLVIREMGLVAAVTFAGAMLADLLLLPALLCFPTGSSALVDNSLEKAA